MDVYKNIFFPTTNSIDQFNESLVLVGMLLTLFMCVMYILFNITHLTNIFKNRDNSLRQNGHIFFKVVFMIIAGYLIYQIVTILLEIGGIK